MIGELVTSGLQELRMPMMTSDFYDYEASKYLSKLVGPSLKSLDLSVDVVTASLVQVFV